MKRIVTWIKEFYAENKDIVISFVFQLLSGAIFIVACRMTMRA